MQAELEALLALQAKDTDILDAQRKVAHLEQRVAQIEQQLDQAAKRNQKLHEKLEEKQIEGRRLSEEVDHLDEHIREQERKLAEEIVSFKEIDTIKASIEHGHQHIDELEEAALALLDEIESEEEAVQQKDETYSQRKAQLEKDLAQVGQEIEAEQKTIGKTQQERTSLWENLPDHLKSIYERLVASVEDPIVMVDGQNCGGCHLQISAQIIKDIRQGTSLVHCEHCSRILYLP